MTKTLRTGDTGDWLSVKEAADELGVSTTTIHQLIYKGEIVAGDFSTGQRRANWRIRREDWNRYVEAALAKASARFAS